MNYPQLPRLECNDHCAELSGTDTVLDGIRQVQRNEKSRKLQIRAACRKFCHRIGSGAACGGTACMQAGAHPPLAVQ